MKAKVYLKMLACLVGLLTFYSCNNDLEQDKNASVAAQQVQNGQEVSLQENAYADYLELMKSTFYITNNSGNDSFSIPFDRTEVITGDRNFVLTLYK